MYSDVNSVNANMKASDLFQKIWSGYVPPQYAGQYPAAWPKQIVAGEIIRDILRQQGVSTAGMSFNSDGSLKDANAKTFLDHVVDISPYIIGAVALGGAAATGGFGGAGGVTAPTVAHTTGAAVGGTTASAAAPAAIVGTTGSGVIAPGVAAGTLATGAPAAATIAGGAAAPVAGGTVAANTLLGGSVLDWTKLGLGGIGSYLSGKSADQQSQLKALVDLMNTQVGREDAQRGSIANYLAGVQANDQTDQRQRSATSLASTQMDPYAQAKDLNAANVRRSYAQGLGSSTSSMVDPRGIDMSAVSPESLQKNADYFYKNAADANPNVPVGAQSPDAEQFRLQQQAAYKTKQQQMQDLIMKYLQQIGSPVVNQPTLPRV